MTECGGVASVTERGGQDRGGGRQMNTVAAEVFRVYIFFISMNFFICKYICIMYLCI